MVAAFIIHSTKHIVQFTPPKSEYENLVVVVVCIQSTKRSTLVAHIVRTISRNV